MATSNDNKQNWREKYLSALDEQEQQEQAHRAQLDMLRRALVRVSLAADGQDDGLDQLLGQLREQLRANQAQLEPLLPRLEAATLAFEQKRKDTGLEVRDALGQSLRRLLQFRLSRSVKKSLQDYLDQLPARVQKIRLYPALLQQLAAIQEQALADIQQPKTGLLDKILGGKGSQAAAVDEQLSDTLEQSAAKPGYQLETSPAAVPAQISISPSDSNLLQDLRRLVEDFLAQLEQAPGLAAEVSGLRASLAQLGEAHQVDNGRQQLLDAIGRMRHLVTQAYLVANQAFASYLNAVNGELADIYALLGGAVQHSDQRQAASRQLQAEMMREMSDLEQQASNASDLNQLKNQVKSQLGNIRQALDKYQQTEQSQQQLSQQLNSLGEKLKLMEAEAEKNRVNLEQQRHRALHDPLTELPNREGYNERAQAEIQRWQRYGRALSIAVVDIDHFKKINDNYGHQTGDRVIKVIGRSIAKRLREVDFFCRYGGEEFVALLPETEGEAALALMEKIREAIAKASFNYKEQPLNISVSIGMTELRQGDTLEQAFERADQALYAAKNAGRNTCRLN